MKRLLPILFALFALPAFAQTVLSTTNVPPTISGAKTFGPSKLCVLKSVSGSACLTFTGSGNSTLDLGSLTSGALLAANNLSDIVSAGAARTNLGLGTLATQSGTFSGSSSSTNTGDDAVNSLYSGLVSNATHTGDATGATALTLATVNANVGSFTNSSITVNAKGLVTAASSGSGGAGTVTSIATTSPISGGPITGAGTISLLVNVDHAFTAGQSVTVNAIGTAGTPGLTLANTTAAAAGAQQYGPALVMTAQGWKTTATAASQEVNWRQQVVPVQGAAAPTANFVFSSQVNGGGYTPAVTFGNTGDITLGGNTSTYLTRITIGNSNDLNITAAAKDHAINAYGFGNVSTGSFYWTDAVGSATNNRDLFLSRSAAATLQQGAANSASPVAQTLRSQGSRAGTDTNVAGSNYAHESGNGTGNAAVSSFIIRVPVAVASGTGAQTMTDSITVNSALTFGSNVVTPAATGVRFLCISTTGVVTSQSAACVGT